jgi:hypothetical protein
MKRKKERKKEKNKSKSFIAVVHSIAPTLSPNCYTFVSTPKSLLGITVWQE